MEEITIIIPTKNEEECIEFTINELRSLGLNKILIADGQSDDKTINIVKKLNCNYFIQSGKGYGNAVIESLKHVNTKYVCFFDSDGSYNPNSIKKMYDILINENLDFVLCSRYKGNLKSDDDTFIRYIGNYFFTSFLKFIFKAKITDFLFHFTLAEKDNYLKLNLEYNSFSLCSEVPIKVHKYGFKYNEIPSKERKRISGKSKVNAFYDGLIILYDMLQLYFKLNFNDQNKKN